MKQKVTFIALLMAISVFPPITVNAQQNKEFTVGDETFTMVFVEGGTFTMGATEDQGADYSQNEKPVHKVTLSDFYIGQTEVTQALWVAVMGYNPSKYQEDLNCPVESVSWDECVNFINKLNKMTGEQFRLPTESEWEFAARGGNKSFGFKYSGGRKICEVAQCYDCLPLGVPRNPTYPVAGKKPNELGIYDMTGNVTEWCSDIYANWPIEFSVRPQTNPKGPAMNPRYIEPRVLRGSNTSTDSDHKDQRIARRDGVEPFKKSEYWGFRLAL